MKFYFDQKDIADLLIKEAQKTATVDPSAVRAVVNFYAVQDCPERSYATVELIPLAPEKS